MASERVRRLDIEAVLRDIRRSVTAAGSLRKLARDWRISPGHLSRVLRKEKAPGDAVLVHLGLREVVRYEQIGAHHGQ